MSTRHDRGRAVLLAARRWWESKRPLTWTLEQHLAAPRVNCAGSGAEDRLALAVAARITANRRKS
jgi:hypothetical protein